MSESEQNIVADAAGHDFVTEHLGYAPRDRVEQYLNSLGGGRCWKCKYFDPSEEVTEGKTSVGNFVSFFQNLFGDCRRHAPIPKATYDPETEERGSIWPWVDGGDWCGEFVECNRSVDDLTGPVSR